MKIALVLLLALHLSDGFLWKLLKNGEIAYQVALPSDEPSKKEPEDTPKESDLDNTDKEEQNKTEDGEGVRKIVRGSYEGSVSQEGSGADVFTTLLSQMIPKDFITKMIMDQLVPKNIQDFLGNFASSFGLKAGRLPSFDEALRGLFDLPAKMLTTLIVPPGQQISAKKRNLSPIEQVIEVIFGVVHGISDFIASVVNYISRMFGVPTTFNRAIKGVKDQTLLITKNILTDVTRDVLTAGFKPLIGMGMIKKAKKSKKQVYTTEYERDEQ